MKNTGKTLAAAFALLAGAALAGPVSAEQAGNGLREDFVYADGLRDRCAELTSQGQLGMCFIMLHDATLYQRSEAEMTSKAVDAAFRTLMTTEGENCARMIGNFEHLMGDLAVLDILRNPSLAVEAAADEYKTPLKDLAVNGAACWEDFAAALEEQGYATEGPASVEAFRDMATALEELAERLEP